MRKVAKYIAFFKFSFNLFQQPKKKKKRLSCYRILANFLYFNGKKKQTHNYASSFTLSQGQTVAAFSRGTVISFARKSQSGSEDFDKKKSMQILDTVRYGKQPFLFFSFCLVYTLGYVSIRLQLDASSTKDFEYTSHIKYKLSMKYFQLKYFVNRWIGFPFFFCELILYSTKNVKHLKKNLSIKNYVY